MELEPILKLTKDIKNAAKVLSDTEARFLVDAYYIMQENRIRTGNQVRSMGESDEPNEVLQWFFTQNQNLEGEVKKALAAYVGSHPIGQWMQAQLGIGPVIAAGFLADLDVNPWRCKKPLGKAEKPCSEAHPHSDYLCGRERIMTAGAFWSFCGMNPDAKWEKGKKRPWNAGLKRLCYLLGESFVKVHNNPKSIYGRLYAEKKAYYEKKNENGDYAELAAKTLEEKNYDKSTDAYAAYISGKLPKAQIHMRAKRFAVKIYLSHLHHVWYQHVFGEAPPKPFAISILGHAHHILPPELPK